MSDEDNVKAAVDQWLTSLDAGDLQGMLDTGVLSLRARSILPGNGHPFPWVTSPQLTTEQKNLDHVCLHEAGHAFRVAAETTPEGTKNPHVMGWAGHCSKGDNSCMMHKTSHDASAFLRYLL